MTEPSGTVGIRLDIPAVLHQRLKVVAAQESSSLKSAIEAALREYVQARAGN